MLTCRYPEGGKRGIPAVYMSNLERRLQETELALYGALAALEEKESIGIESLAVPQLKQSTTLGWRQLSKIEKQEEWTRLPLDSKEQLAIWFRDKQRAFHDTETQEEHPLSCELTSFASPDGRGKGVCGHNSRAGTNIPRQPEHPPSVVLQRQQTNSGSNIEQLRGFQVPVVPNSVHNKVSSPWQNYF